MLLSPPLLTVDARPPTTTWCCAGAEVPVDFEWDDTKAALNTRKHGVSFLEAMTVFADWFALTGYDPDHSDHEDRYLTMGVSAAGFAAHLN